MEKEFFFDPICTPQLNEDRNYDSSSTASLRFMPNLIHSEEQWSEDCRSSTPFRFPGAAQLCCLKRFKAEKCDDSSAGSDAQTLYHWPQRVCNDDDHLYATVGRRASPVQHHQDAYNLSLFPHTQELSSTLAQCCSPQHTAWGSVVPSCTPFEQHTPFGSTTQDDACKTKTILFNDPLPSVLYHESSNYIPTLPEPSWRSESSLKRFMSSASLSSPLHYSARYSSMQTCAPMHDDSSGVERILEPQRSVAVGFQNSRHAVRDATQTSSSCTQRTEMQPLYCSLLNSQLVAPTLDAYGAPLLDSGFPTPSRHEANDYYQQTRSSETHKCQALLPGATTTDDSNNSRHSVSKSHVYVYSKASCSGKRALIPFTVRPRLWKQKESWGNLNLHSVLKDLPVLHLENKRRGAIHYKECRDPRSDHIASVNGNSFTNDVHAVQWGAQGCDQWLANDAQQHTNLTEKNNQLSENICTEATDGSCSFERHTPFCQENKLQINWSKEHLPGCASPRYNTEPTNNCSVPLHTKDNASLEEALETSMTSAISEHKGYVNDIVSNVAYAQDTPTLTTQEHLNTRSASGISSETFNSNKVSSPIHSIPSVPEVMGAKASPVSSPGSGAERRAMVEDTKALPPFTRSTSETTPCSRINEKKTPRNSSSSLVMGSSLLPHNQREQTEDISSVRQQGNPAVSNAHEGSSEKKNGNIDDGCKFSLYSPLIPSDASLRTKKIYQTEESIQQQVPASEIFSQGPVLGDALVDTKEKNNAFRGPMRRDIGQTGVLETRNSFTPSPTEGPAEQQERRRSGNNCSTSPSTSVPQCILNLSSEVGPQEKAYTLPNKHFSESGTFYSFPFSPHLYSKVVVNAELESAELRVERYAQTGCESIYSQLQFPYGRRHTSCTSSDNLSGTIHNAGLGYALIPESSKSEHPTCSESIHFENSAKVVPALCYNKCASQKHYRSPTTATTSCSVSSTEETASVTSLSKPAKPLAAIHNEEAEYCLLPPHLINEFNARQPTGSMRSSLNGSHYTPTLYETSLGIHPLCNMYTTQLAPCDIQHNIQAKAAEQVHIKQLCAELHHEQFQTYFGDSQTSMASGTQIPVGSGVRQEFPSYFIDVAQRTVEEEAASEIEKGCLSTGTTLGCAGDGSSERGLLCSRTVPDALYGDTQHHSYGSSAESCIHAAATRSGGREVDQPRYSLSYMTSQRPNAVAAGALAPPCVIVLPSNPSSEPPASHMLNSFICSPTLKPDTLIQQSDNSGNSGYYGAIQDVGTKTQQPFYAGSSSVSKNVTDTIAAKHDQAAAGANLTPLAGAPSICCDKQQFNVISDGLTNSQQSGIYGIECLNAEYRKLLKNIPRKSREAFTPSDLAAFRTCHPQYSRNCFILMQNGYDIRLGEVGRAALKKEISRRLKGDSELRERCVSVVCRLKNANVLQLLQMAEISGCLLLGLKISSGYWREYSKKQRPPSHNASSSSSSSFQRHYKADQTTAVVNQPDNSKFVSCNKEEDSCFSNQLGKASKHERATLCASDTRNRQAAFKLKASQDTVNTSYSHHSQMVLSKRATNTTTASYNNVFLSHYTPIPGATQQLGDTSFASQNQPTSLHTTSAPFNCSKGGLNTGFSRLLLQNQQLDDVREPLADTVESTLCHKIQYQQCDRPSPQSAVLSDCNDTMLDDHHALSAALDHSPFSHTTNVTASLLNKSTHCPQVCSDAFHKPLDALCSQRPLLVDEHRHFDDIHLDSSSPVILNVPSSHCGTAVTPPTQSNSPSTMPLSLNSVVDYDAHTTHLTKAGANAFLPSTFLGYPPSLEPSISWSLPYPKTNVCIEDMYVLRENPSFCSLTPYVQKPQQMPTVTNFTDASNGTHISSNLDVPSRAETSSMLSSSDHLQCSYANRRRPRPPEPVDFCGVSGKRQAQYISNTEHPDIQLAVSKDCWKNYSITDHLDRIVTRDNGAIPSLATLNENAYPVPEPKLQPFSDSTSLREVVSEHVEPVISVCDDYASSSTSFPLCLEQNEVITDSGHCAAFYGSSVVSGTVTPTLAGCDHHIKLQPGLDGIAANVCEASMSTDDQNCSMSCSPAPCDTTEQVCCDISPSSSCADVLERDAVSVSQLTTAASCASAVLEPSTMNADVEEKNDDQRRLSQRLTPEPLRTAVGPAQGKPPQPCPTFVNICLEPSLGKCRRIKSCEPGVPGDEAKSGLFSTLEDQHYFDSDATLREPPNVFDPHYSPFKAAQKNDMPTSMLNRDNKTSSFLARDHCVSSTTTVASIAG